MNHVFEDAVCATADLAARLEAELALASSQLALAEHRFRAAAANAVSSAAIPFGIRRERTEGRRLVESLRQVLGGLPAIGGGMPC